SALAARPSFLERRGPRSGRRRRQQLGRRQGRQMKGGALPRIAVVGLGFGAVHARVLGEMENVDLVAICDVDRARLAAVGRGRSVALHEDYGAMLGQERLDAVVVAVPTRLHEEVAVAAIRAGVKAILVEKPIAPTLGEARRLADAAEAAGVSLMPGHVE